MSLIKKHVELDGKDYDLWRDSADGVLRAKDLDVAAWLQFGHPREFRKLVVRHLSSLGEVSSYRDPKPGKLGGRPEEGYLLTREQVLYLAAKSETPRATEILKAMIAVFALAMDGRLPSAAQIDAMREELAQLRGQVRALATRHDQVIGEGLARGVLQRIAQIAAFRACVHRRSLASLRAMEETEIRGVVGLARDQPWRLLGVFRYPALLQELHRRERRARRDAESADLGRQRGLSWP